MELESGPDEDGLMRFAEEHIIAVLEEREAGAKTADLARKHGISEATLLQLEGQIRWGEHSPKPSG